MTADLIERGIDGIARIRGVPVANLVGLIESGFTEQEVAALYAGCGLGIEEVAAALGFARRAAVER